MKGIIISMLNIVIIPGRNGFEMLNDKNIKKL